MLIHQKETASSLSVIAAKKAISSSNIKKDDIGLVVGCTFTLIIDFQV